MTKEEIKQLLSKTVTARLATCCDNQSYVVPICFIYYKEKIYFHSSPSGMKMRYMKKNPKVCFQVDEEEIVPARSPCKFTARYKSVIVFGKVRFLKDRIDKLEILKKMINKYDVENISEPLKADMVQDVEIGEITIDKVTGRKNMQK